MLQRFGTRNTFRAVIVAEHSEFRILPLEILDDTVLLSSDPVSPHDVIPVIVL